MYYMINIIVAVVCGVIAASLASNKNRSTVGWFFGGFFLGVIGIVIIALQKDPRIEENQRRHMTQENRRLKEQLHQEKIKNETFRQYATKRLDSHDRELGVDTKSQNILTDDSKYKPSFLDRLQDKNVNSNE